MASRALLNFMRCDAKDRIDPKFNSSATQELQAGKRQTKLDEQGHIAAGYSFSGILSDWEGWSRKALLDSNLLTQSLFSSSTTAKSTDSSMKMS